MEKAMAPYSSTVAWKIPWMGEPGGLPSIRSHRVGHDWSNLAAAAAVSHGSTPGHSVLMSERLSALVFWKSSTWLMGKSPCSSFLITSFTPGRLAHSLESVWKKKKQSVWVSLIPQPTSPSPTPPLCKITELCHRIKKIWPRRRKQMDIFQQQEFVAFLSRMLRLL